MQSWRDHAQKNKIEIIDNGDCQLCGAILDYGISQCVDLSSNTAHELTHQDGIKHMTIFLCVDAHALQHAEIHGRWNNHFHLSRLDLILNEHIQWTYRLSSRLSEVIDSYKASHLDERILPPEAGKRGVITISDVYRAQSDGEYIELAHQWATDVYESFAAGHEISQEISSVFKSKNRL